MAFDDPGTRMALDLGAFMAAPSSLLDPACAIDADLLALLPDQGPMAHLREGLLRDRIDPASHPLCTDFLARLASRPHYRLALTLALLPPPRLHDLRRHLAAVINQDRLRAAVLKSDRQAFVLAFGADAVQAGLEQAGFFAPHLARLARSDLQIDALLHHAGGLIIALVQAEDALAARILELRLQGFLRIDAPDEALGGVLWRQIGDWL